MIIMNFTYSKMFCLSKVWILLIVSLRFTLIENMVSGLMRKKLFTIMIVSISEGFLIFVYLLFDLFVIYIRLAPNLK